MRRSKASQLLASILVNAIYAMKNYPIMMVNAFVSPLAFLIVLTLVSRGALFGVAVIGGLIMALTSSGLSLQGDLVHFKVDFKLQDMVVSSPTTAFIYLFGMAISELIYYLPGIAVLLAMAFINLKFGLFPTLQVTGAMILMFVLATALGFMLSTHISDIMESWAVTGVVSILLSTIPPVYYPITYIPLPYRYAAYLSPTTYAAQIAQQAMGYIHFPQVTIDIDWIVLIGVSVVLLLISVKKTRWREI